MNLLKAIAGLLLFPVAVLRGALAFGTLLWQDFFPPRTWKDS